MSYRSLFDATMTAEPPSRTTVDTVIARARRRLRFRPFRPRSSTRFPDSTSVGR
jgi:hypothetical protein